MNCTCLEDVLRLKHVDVAHIHVVGWNVNNSQDPLVFKVALPRHEGQGVLSVPRVPDQHALLLEWVVVE